MVEFHHQWQFLYQRCAWYDFTLVSLSVENDKMFGNVEASIWLFGFGVRLVWDYADTDTGRKVAQQIADFDAN